MPIFLSEPVNQVHDTAKRQILVERQFLQNHLFIRWGRKLCEWPLDTIQNAITNKKRRLPLSNLEQKKYPFSNHKAAFNKFISDLLAMLQWKAICKGISSWNRNRFSGGHKIFLNGSTYAQRFFLTSVILLFEIIMPLLWLSCFIAAVIIRILLETRVRFPLLWLFYFAISRSGINGTEALRPGEDGYTREFQGGKHVDLDDLENELMKRNDESSPNDPEANVHTICISYKHYANKDMIPGDDHRICRTDLQAIAQLIKTAAPCKLRLWIDTKLPKTDDSTFERWLNRGVRPYGRYITFLCPSAQQHAQSSFWLSNEYHFTSAAKGAMYFENDEIFYDLRYGYNLDLYRRFLLVLIEAERHPVNVRDEDKGKVIRWAMCCLRAEERGVESMYSPNIDNMRMTGKLSHHFSLMNNISNVIRKYGPQELPVQQGKNWNKQNPLLRAGLPDLEFDLSTWYGLSLDESPATVYFLHDSHLFDIKFDTVVVLEVGLDRPHFNPGKIRVVRKVLTELSSSVLMRCKFVTLPWVCDWE